MYNPLHPPPAPPAFGSHTVIPERRANILSRLVFHWLSPLLSVGFTRPLQEDDLWQLHNLNKSRSNADSLETHFYRDFEVPKAIDKPDSGIDTQGDTQGEKEDVETKEHSSTSIEEEKAKSDPKVKQKKPSLVKSIHAVYWKRIWLAGIFKLFGDTLQTVSPLVNKALLNWLTIAFLAAKGGGAGQADGL